MPSISDAAVGNALAWSQVADTLAQTQERGVLNQGRVLDTLIKAQNLQQQENLRKLLQPDAPVPGAGTIPESAQPSAPQVPSGTPQSGAQAVGILGDFSPGGLIEKNITDMVQQEKKYRALSQAQGIPVDSSIAFLKSADDLKSKITNEVLNLQGKRREILKDVGGAAGTVKDEASMQAAANQINAIAPGLLRTLPADRLPDGNLLYTPKTQAAFAQLADSSTTRAEQMADADRVARLKETELNNKRLEEDRQARLEETRLNRERLDASTAAQRDATAAQRERTESDRQETRYQRAQTQAQDISSEFRKDPLVKEFVEHKQAFTTGVNYVFNPDGTPKSQGTNAKDWQNFSPEGDLALSRQYLSVVHPGYKGQIADVKELANFKNLPEKIASAFSSLAAGKTLSQSDRIAMVNAMQSVVKTENTTMLEKENENLKKIQTLQLPPGTDPTIYVPKYAIRPKDIAKTPAPDNVPDGATATNPTTGMKMIKRNGQWQPMQ